MTMKTLLGASMLTMASLALAGPAHAKTPADQLVLGVSLAQVLSLDPGQATEPGAAIVMANTYDRLVTTEDRDPTKLLPQLAESWVIKDDAVTLRLRKATFNSGNPVTADDVVWSIARVLKMNQASAAQLKPYGFDEKNVDTLLKAVDAQTVSIGLPDGANGEFIMYALAGVIGSVIDKTEALKHEVGGDYANAWLRTNSAGSGPYKLTRWTPNEIILLERNDQFWGPKPTMRRAALRHVAESQVQRLLLERGDLDVATQLGASDLNAFVDKKGFEIQRVPTGGYYVLSMNAGNPYLANPDVRRAIAWGIDYAGIEKTILGPYGRSRQGPVPINFPGAIEGPNYSLDVAKAKALLAKAGYPDGFPLVLKTISETPRVDMSTAIQASLALIGIKVSIEQGNGSQIIAAHRGRQYDLLIPQSGAAIPNALGSMFNFVYNPDNSEKGNPGFFTWRSNWIVPELNTLYDATMKEKDAGKREVNYKKMQEIFNNSAPAVFPMFERFNPIVITSNVQNYVGQGFRGTRFDAVTKSE